jgi:hypothetical protein
MSQFEGATGEGKSVLVLACKILLFTLATVVLAIAQKYKVCADIIKIV